MVNLTVLDWSVIGLFLLAVIAIGSAAALFTKKSASDFFLSGRSMPWWLLGVSMVACTFSCDTPNLVTDIVRTQGVSGNWAWWAFLLTGMLTVFIYAKLWRRSALDTDLGFYEIRYGGKPAAVLRGFRALYLGVLFNVLVLGTVSLAAIKIGQVIFGLSPELSLLVGMGGVAVYATLGGLTGSIWADFFQYAIAMGGAIYAAYYAVTAPELGGGSLQAILANTEVAAKSAMVPTVQNGNWSQLITLLILPIAVQWWNVWYPGSEPGGGGYIAQRMLSAKDEKNAVGATLLFNFLHYAVRPWPWILVALVSLIVFSPDPAKVAQEALANPKVVASATPEQVAKWEKDKLGPTKAQAAAWWQDKANRDLVSAYERKDKSLAGADLEKVKRYYYAKEGLTALREAFPGVEEQFLRNDMAYPAMVSKMPKGWLGLIIASLIAAYMSTLATHLNWGSSYVVQDFWTRFVDKNCPPKRAVLIGRLTMLLLLVLSALTALWMQNAKGAFNILLQVGAGTGLIYILRWFWWRVNAYSEISAMIASFAIACFFQWGAPVLGLEHIFSDAGLFKVMDWASWQLVLSILATTLIWLTVTFITRPEKDEILIAFCRKIRAGGPGWKRFEQHLGAETKEKWDVPYGILCMMLGCIAVWSVLFGVGDLLYANTVRGAVLCATSAVTTFILMKCVSKARFS